MNNKILKCCLCKKAKAVYIVGTKPKAYCEKCYIKHSQKKLMLKLNLDESREYKK